MTYDVYINIYSIESKIERQVNIYLYKMIESMCQLENGLLIFCLREPSFTVISLKKKAYETRVRNNFTEKAIMLDVYTETGDYVDTGVNASSGIEVARDAEALEALAECGILTPAYQDGVFYTDTDGAIYVL